MTAKKKTKSKLRKLLKKAPKKELKKEVRNAWRPQCSPWSLSRPTGNLTKTSLCSTPKSLRYWHAYRVVFSITCPC